jgi:hypothetical protein
MTKAALPAGARTACACKNYCFFYCFFSLAGSSAGADELLLEDDGALDPLDALPLGGVLGELLIEPLELLAPPDAESFFVGSADEEELDEDGELGVELIDPEPEAEPDGELGVVEPADEDDPEVGLLETARSPSCLSQPVSNPAPSARETATAKA